MSLEVVDTTREVVNMRVRGKDFGEIADALGLFSAQRAREKFYEYMHTAYADSTDVELRFLQLKRLEKMVDYLWDQVAEGDTLSEGRQTANLIKVIEEINKLMGLHRDALAEAQVKLTEAQTAMIYEVMKQMRTSMLDQAMEDLRSETQMLGAEAGERIRTAIETGWARWHQQAVSDAVVLIEAQEGTTST